MGKRKQNLLILILILGLNSPIFAANKSFNFKIKTKSGTIVNNVHIEVNPRSLGESAARVKLMKRYPNCIVLDVR